MLRRAVLCCAKNRAADAYTDEYIAQQKLEQTVCLTGVLMSRSTSLGNSGRTLSSSEHTRGSTLSSCGSLVGSSRPGHLAISAGHDWLPDTAALQLPAPQAKHSSMFSALTTAATTGVPTAAWLWDVEWPSLHRTNKVFPGCWNRAHASD